MTAPIPRCRHGAIVNCSACVIERLTQERDAARAALLKVVEVAALAHDGPSTSLCLEVVRLTAVNALLPRGST